MAIITTNNQYYTDIANAIRGKNGESTLYKPSEMALALNSIADRTNSDLTVSGETVSIPKGNYKEDTTKSVSTATQATPSISVNSSGLITASSEQSAGYVYAGTKSATQQLSTQAKQTIIPGTSNKTIASGKYLIGTQTIKGDANLVAENIVKGKTIFGVSGNYTGSTYQLIVKTDTGSTVKATKGSTVVTATEQNGIWGFNGLDAGTWDITCTKNGYTVSNNVTIVNGAACQILEMYYYTYLIKDGVEIDAVYERLNVTAATEDDRFVIRSNNGGTNMQLVTWDNVNILAAYKTLHLTGEFNLATGDHFISVDLTNARVDYTATGASLDVSALSGIYKIVLKIPNATWQFIDDLYFSY